MEVVLLHEMVEKAFHSSDEPAAGCGQNKVECCRLAAVDEGLDMDCEAVAVVVLVPGGTGYLHYYHTRVAAMTRFDFDADADALDLLVGCYIDDDFQYGS